MACFLEIRQPNGDLYSSDRQKDGMYQLSKIISPPEKNEITIGRDESNDIYLPVDDKKISRRHCSIEIKDHCYFYVKSDSTHKTCLRPANPSDPNVDIYVINDKKEDGYRLRNGDEILIASKFPDSGNPYWRCVFYDDNETDPAKRIDLFQIKYHYHLESRELYIESSIQEKQSIPFKGQERDLVEYLAKKVGEDGDLSDIATYSNFNDHPLMISKDNLRVLVSRIHSKITEEIIKQTRIKRKDVPKLIENVNGYGYRLNKCHVTIISE
jgi:hypothetical protein